METRSNNYEFLKPHEDDFYDIEVQNGNWDKVDEALKEIDNKKVNTSGGDISETVIKTLEEQEDFPEIPASGPVKTIFGKIRKNLEDWKAFKDGIVTIGRLSNIDANDSDKIPTSAFVHTLYKRIGMETELAAGDNLTVAVNRLDSDLNGVITDKSYNNDTIIDMVKAHWEDLPTGISTKQFNSGGNLWYLICNKANAAAGAYFLYTHNPAFKSPIYGQCQNGIWYDQGGIALSNHTHDDRYYTETEIKKMMSSQYENNTGKLATSAIVYALKQITDQLNNNISYSSGKATINTTYVACTNTTYVNWMKFGRIVVVDIYDVDLKSGVNTENVAVLATGLPKPVTNQIVGVYPGLSPNNEISRVRVAICPDGSLRPWYMGTTPNVVSICGNFVYVSAS